jgi:shikimate dehydrogenase
MHHRDTTTLMGSKEALHFIGVSTSGSSIMKLFPVWAKTLGLNAEIVGRDIPLRADPSAYRGVVEEIAARRHVRGALVTTHKVDIYRNARHLFAEIDPLGRLCREVSCISKRDSAIIGHAKDPMTAGLAMDHMLGPDYWSGSRGEVLCLGAGGAGTAITIRLLSQQHRPRSITVVDRDAARIEALREIHAQMGASVRIAYLVASEATMNDELVASLPPESLVINATGMGKDVPGSPVSDAVRFPAEGVVWDLNYRGDLVFLEEARRQAAERHLRVHDGWRYFLHGWTEVIAEVFELDMTQERFDRLAQVAESARR